MVDTWNPAVLNETTQAIDSWNPAELNQVTTKVDSWNAAILNNNLESITPIVFSATITASFPEGATCTATDGTTTLTADDNPMAFSIPNSGTWAVACVANGVTFSEDVVITTDGQTESVDLTPIGETVTPTDSVPVLIACAGIGDSEITTIAGALADVETLTSILESENAINYLVRSTAFASDVTSDSVAMEGIGAINYDANTLLADSTWLNAICNSTYFESVLNVKVPTMTSNTVPEGQCVGSADILTAKSYYMAFDKDDSTYVEYTTTSGHHTGYKFTNAVEIKAFMFYFQTSVPQTHNITLKCSDDGITWTDVDTVSYTTRVKSKYAVTGAGSHQYWSVYLSNSSHYMCNEIDFYAREDV